MTAARAPVEAVIFDWGGTLTPWHAIDLMRPWRAYAEMYDRAHAADLAERLHARETETWQAAREQHASGTLDDIFASCGVDLSSAPHAAALAAYHEVWLPHTYLDPDVAPLFDSLRERMIKIGVLSNTLWTREYHEEVFARDGILDRIDGAVYSSEIKWTKPHRRAFLAAVAAVGVDDPTRCVYVGDRLFEDVWGPQQLGMRAVYVPHSRIPDVQRGHTDGTPDAVVQRLADLLPVIDKWTSRVTE